MTENEAIVVLQKIKPIPHRGDSKSTTHILETIALDMAIKALEQTRWIPCAERLPEDGDTYLVTIEYKGEVIGVDVASYSPVDGYIDKHWETFNDWKEDDDSCYHVTAWMPLPSSYQGESEGERMKTFYQCDPELFWSCEHTLCQKECTLTSFEKYAKRDEFGRAIVACIDDSFEPAEESEDKR